MLVVPVAPAPAKADPAGEEAGGERDAEEDQHGPGDLPEADLESLGVETEPARQHGQVEVAEQRVGRQLEDRVEDDEHRGAVAVAAGELVPDQHHRDAAGETDDDHAGAIGGWSARKSQASANISSGPTTQERKSETVKKRRLSMPSCLRLPEFLVPDLREDRYIISSNPIAIGRLTVPIWSFVQPVVEPGQQRAEPEPTAIANPIQSGRKRSSVDS